MDPRKQTSRYLYQLVDVLVDVFGDSYFVSERSATRAVQPADYGVCLGWISPGDENAVAIIFHEHAGAPPEPFARASTAAAYDRVFRRLTEEYDWAPTYLESINPAVSWVGLDTAA